MHLHALNQAITLYRGETFTLEQATRHAGVSTGRMEAALRSRNVPVRERPDAPTPIGTDGPDPATEASAPGADPLDADPFGNPSAGAD